MGLVAVSRPLPCRLGRHELPPASASCAVVVCGSAGRCCFPDAACEPGGDGSESWAAVMWLDRGGVALLALVLSLVLVIALVISVTSTISLTVAIAVLLAIALSIGGGPCP